MKRASFVCLSLFIVAFLFGQSNFVSRAKQQTSKAAPPDASRPDAKAQAKILNNYGKLPLSFEENHGQTDARVKFLSRTSSYTLFLTGDEAVLALSGKTVSTNKAKTTGISHAQTPAIMGARKAGAVLRMKLHNADPAAKVTGVNELVGTSTYFVGNDPSKWRTGVPTYAKVNYQGIYPGIDLVYYGNQRQLEYDFIVAPGADPRRITFDIRGSKRIRRDERGDLVLQMGGGEIRWQKPVVYQEKGGARQEIAARYAITRMSRVGFELANFDASRPLYIDPLLYSTYLGGGGDVGQAIAVDNGGNAYVTGATGSANFPVTPGAFQTVCNGGSNCSLYGDAFVTKINPEGTALVYSTYLGGSGAEDYSSNGAIAVDSEGNAYVTGDTGLTDFPTLNPLQPDNINVITSAFVAKINSTGSLTYSTYLGGSGGTGNAFTNGDTGRGIAVDTGGSAYVTGATSSTNFPVTSGAFQTVCNGGSNCGQYWDAFVTKVNAAGSSLVYSTYLGGSSFDSSYGIAVDSAGNAYVTGQTNSTNFPTYNAMQPTNANPANGNAFVTEINAAGSALASSTYLGGSGCASNCGEDQGYGIAVDGADSAYVTGQTTSTNFPVTSGAFQTSLNGSYGNAFVTKMPPVTPSFTVAGTAVSVSPGATTGNTSTIAVTPSGGFTGNVTLTAAITSSPTGAQDSPTLSFGSTSPVSITNANAGTATLTISTTAATNGALAYPVRPGVRLYATGGAGLAFALVLGMGVPTRRRSWRARLGLLVILLALSGGLLACGSGGSGGGVGGNPGTTAGTYTVTVTGTSGSTMETGTVTLTVQ